MLSPSMATLVPNAWVSTSRLAANWFCACHKPARAAVAMINMGGHFFRRSNDQAVRRHTDTGSKTRYDVSNQDLSVVPFAFCGALEQMDFSSLLGASPGSTHGDGIVVHVNRMTEQTFVLGIGTNNAAFCVQETPKG